MNSKKILLIVLVVYSIFISCKNSNKDTYEIFFDEAESNLTKQDRQMLDSCFEIQCRISFIFKSKNQNFKKKFKIIPSKILNDMELKHIPDYNRQWVLFLAFCKDREKENFDFNKISDEFDASDTSFVERIIHPSERQLLSP